MKKLLRHDTSADPVFIAQSPDGRFHIWRKVESLGSYETIAQAIGDAAGGHHFSASDGVDLGSLDLSDNPADWVRSALDSD